MEPIDRLTLQVLAEQAPLTPLPLMQRYMVCTQTDDGYWAYEAGQTRWEGLLICPRCAFKASNAAVALAPPQPRFRRPCCGCRVTLNPV